MAPDRRINGATAAKCAATNRRVNPFYRAIGQMRDQVFMGEG